MAFLAKATLEVPRGVSLESILEIPLELTFKAAIRLFCLAMTEAAEGFGLFVTKVAFVQALVSLEDLRPLLRPECVTVEALLELEAALDLVFKLEDSLAF